MDLLCKNMEVWSHLFGQGLTPLFSKCLMAQSQRCTLAEVLQTESHCYPWENRNAAARLMRDLQFLTVLAAFWSRVCLWSHVGIRGMNWDVLSWENGVIGTIQLRVVWITSWHFLQISSPKIVSKPLLWCWSWTLYHMTWSRRITVRKILASPDYFAQKVNNQYHFLQICTPTPGK